MTASALLYKYPLDLTGKNPTNLVLREPHTIGAATERAIVTNAGPFYTEGLVVREAVSGKILVPYTQYLILQPYQEASVKTGLDVAAIVYITDLTIDTEILIDYQCVGGEFSWSVYALKAMLEAAELDSRPVHWMDIVGRPTAFRPSPHLHDLGDSYGWEYIAEQLEGIRSAILLGDAASHDELRQQLNLALDVLRNSNNELKAAFELHKIDYTNSHRVTAAQVGLGNVQNSRHATDPEAAYAANPNNVAPITTYVIDVKNLNAAMRSFNAAVVTPHINDFNDPHNVTAAQVGLGSILNYGMSTKVEAEQGLTELKYMNPLRTKEAIAKLALEPLTTHINNKNDPHDVTKLQVGLGNVVDALQATVNETESAMNPGAVVTGNKYINISGINAAFNLYYTAITQPHENNYLNPHQTDKAQVGLGSVENYPMATLAQAQQGIVSTAYMSPLRTKDALLNYRVTVLDTTFATIAALNTHISGNGTNPHGTTKGDVMLGNVPNAISNARNLNSEASLATSKAMFDHVGSGDHDGRYVPANSGVSGSIHIREDLGHAYVWVGGGWRLFWPPQWQ